MDSYFTDIVRNTCQACTTAGNEQNTKPVQNVQVFYFAHSLHL